MPALFIVQEESRDKGKIQQTWVFQQLVIRMQFVMRQKPLILMQSIMRLVRRETSCFRSPVLWAGCRAEPLPWCLCFLFQGTKESKGGIRRAAHSRPLPMHPPHFGCIQGQWGGFSELVLMSFSMSRCILVTKGLI